MPHQPNSITNHHSYSNPLGDLRAGLLTNAKLLESCLDPNDINFYSNVLDRIAGNVGTNDITTWFANVPQHFREYLKRRAMSSPRLDPVRREIFYVAAVAANLVLYFSGRPGDFLSDLRLPLLHLAVAGPDLVPSELVDHSAMIKALVRSGCQINKLKDITEFFNRNHPNIFQGLNLMMFQTDHTPLAYLLGLRGLNSRSEETRLQIARTLLKLGADVNTYIFTANSLKLTSLVGYCVRLETVAFVRLFLQHSPLNSPYFHDEVGKAGLLRGDKEIIQALTDYGISFKNLVKKPETLPELLVFAANPFSASVEKPI